MDESSFKILKRVMKSLVNPLNVEGLEIYMTNHTKKIVIDDKSYILNDDKKNIKKRITHVIEDDVERIDPEANKAVVSKTIKDYLDGIMIKFGLK